MSAPSEDREAPTPAPAPTPEGEGPTYPAALVRRIAALTAVTSALCAVGLGVSYGGASAFGVLVGAALGLANLWALAKLVVALLREAPEGEAGGAKARAAVLLGLKSIGLVTVVGVLIVRGLVHGGALMAGLSMVALSIVLATVLPGGGTNPPGARGGHGDERDAP